MKIFALSDLHLSFSCDKPMDIFGGNWENYTDKIKENWERLVGKDDIVLIAGDISWAMRLDEARADLDWIDALPGKKIIIKGNHEYWWQSISAVREVLPSSIVALQNDSIRIGKYIFCGTRGWIVPEENRPLEPEDEKIYKREIERLKLTLSSMNTLRQDGDKVVAMMHYPPYTYNRGKTEFTELFEKFKVDAVVFGHLHGKINCEPIAEINQIKYYFTSCDHTNMTPVLIYDE